MLFWILLYFATFAIGGAVAGPFIGLAGPWPPSRFSAVWLGAFAGLFASVTWPLALPVAVYSAVTGR